MPLETFLKNRSLSVASMNYSVKSLRNIIGLASTNKSVTFYICGIRDVVPFKGAYTIKDHRTVGEV